LGDTETLGGPYPRILPVATGLSTSETTRFQNRRRIRVALLQTYCHLQEMFRKYCKKFILQLSATQIISCSIRSNWPKRLFC